MSRRLRPSHLLTVLAVSFATFAVAGCFSSAPAPGSREAATSDERDDTSRLFSTGNADATAEERGWEDYPDVPYVDIMQEIDGLEIPRLEAAAEDLQMEGEVPVDVGNSHAQKNPGEPATGDWLTVRFNSEPKSLNPVVETSAVQTYIGGYVQEGLARRDPETLEYEPHIAERWVAEDSVKLSSDYPGHERRIALDGDQPTSGLEVEYPQTADGEEPPVLTFNTSGGEGKLLGEVWVGLYPAEKIPGAPVNGYHFWSDEEGELQVSAIVPGRYEVRVGAELFGKTARQDDGSLTVKPETPGNPLHEMLKSDEQESLTLAEGEWVDVHEQTIYTYFLRDDVTWSDGTPFTSRDIEFAYAVINNPYVDGDSIRVYYQDLIACDAIDDHTVRMQYRQQYFLAFEFTYAISAFAPPWHQFEAIFEEDGKTLTMAQLSPEEEEARDEVSVHGQTFGRFFNTDPRYNQNPLGTGPYIVDRWQRADRIELRRNPDYWNEERAGYLDRLVFKFIVDNVTAMQALRSGEIDFMWNMDPEQFFEDLAGPPGWFRDRYVKASWYSPGFSYVGWNLLNPMFEDRRVRIALSLLFDRKQFVDQKLHGEAALVSGSQYIFGPAYDHEVKPLGHDVELARDLLADAGWVDTNNDGILDKDGRNFEFTLMYPPGNPIVDEQAALMQRAFRRVGIQMRVRRFEWASFIDKVRARDFDAVRLGWASSLESDPFQIWHGSQAGRDKRGSNHVSFSNRQADELIEMLRLTLDEDKRQRIHASFHRILDREQPYMFLYTSKDFGAYHQRFRGVKWYRLRPGFDLTEWYVPKDEQVR